MALSHTAVSWIFVFVICVQGEYMGCFVDNHDRILKARTYMGPNLTTDGCIRWCLEHGNLLAGTQFTSHCFCGDSIDMTTLTNDDECDMHCSGNGREICGGAWRMSVYKTGGQRAATEIQTTTDSTTTKKRHTTNADKRTITGAVDIETANTNNINVVKPTTSIPTSPSDEHGHSACNCICYHTKWNSSTRLTTTEMLKLRSELKAMLTVMKNSTSMFRRKLKSEYDSRRSSVTIGCFAIVILLFIAAMIVTPDIAHLILYVHRCRRCCHKKCRQGITSVNAGMT